jgi:tripartite-type tricarboxylate transporter receptor subunit TctC
MADVIAYAKAAPDGIDMASSGNGTLQHLSLEMFRFMTGTRVHHVPYRGGGPALNDVIGGQVKLFFSNGSSVVGIIQGGQVKAIAHTGRGRLGTLPDLPAGFQSTFARNSVRFGIRLWTPLLGRYADQGTGAGTPTTTPH